MIPAMYIAHWRTKVPWASDAQVEQDLVLSRALGEIYSDPLLSTELAFRGGTALHKLFLAPAGRYSEDIDLVQVQAGAIGVVINAFRAKLDPWLGSPQRKQGHGRVTLVYRFLSEIPPIVPIKLKIEINTREHFSVLGLSSYPFEIDSPWYKNKVKISTYKLEELLGTKLRALYQRKKGRDLYDLWIALSRYPSLEVPKIIQCFRHYMEHGEHKVSRSEYLANLDQKMRDPTFRNDIFPLLSKIENYDPDVANRMIIQQILDAL